MTRNGERLNLKQKKNTTKEYHQQKKNTKENFIIKITPTSYCFKYNADSEIHI